MSTTYIFFKKDGFEDFGENVICPLCGELSTESDIDDYTNLNMVMYCKTHQEILLCIEPDYMDDLYEGIERGCLKLVNKDEVRQHYKTRFSNGTSYPKNVDKLLNGDYYIYKCGVLKINKIISSGDKIFDKDEDDFWDSLKVNPRLLDEYYHNVDIKSFSETNFHTSHDGIYLYYKGECMQCHKCYESFIWGD